MIVCVFYLDTGSNDIELARDYLIHVASQNKNNPNPSPTEIRFGLFFFGTPEGTRTPDLLIRSQSLYPTELPAHTCGCLTRSDILAHCFWKCKPFFENLLKKLFCRLGKKKVISSAKGVDKSAKSVIMRFAVAGVAHPVERHLAKVEVASSSLVTRSRFRRHFWYKMAWEKLPIFRGFFFMSAPIFLGTI